MPDYRFEVKVFETFPINTVVQFYNKIENDFRNAVVIGYSLSDKNELLVDCKVICRPDYVGESIFKINPKSSDLQLAAILSQTILYV